MKLAFWLAPVYLLFILLLSCSKSPVDGFPTEYGTGNSLLLYSGRILTPAIGSTPLTLCLNQVGTPMQIRSTDQLQILFAIGYQTHELKIAAPATVADLIQQMVSFAETKGAIIAITPTDSGSYLLKNTGNKLTYLKVNNLSNATSSGLLEKTFNWGTYYGPADISFGKCLAYADASSPLQRLLDSSGLSLGLEKGDTIRLQEEGRNLGIVTHTEQQVVVDSTQTAGALLSLISGVFPKSTPSFGSLSETKGIGRVTMRKLSMEDGTYVIRLYASYRSYETITPSKFNRNFQFQ